MALSDIYEFRAEIPWQCEWCGRRIGPAQNGYATHYGVCCTKRHAEVLIAFRKGAGAKVSHSPALLQLLLGLRPQEEP